jgi:hypothetical protein
MRRIYLLASLRLPKVRMLAAALRAYGHEVFDDWHAAGPEADDIWQAYEKGRGRSMVEALRAPHAQMVIGFDQWNLVERDTVVLVMPAGKSCHIELGFAIGLGKDTHVLFDGEPDRWDAMYGYAKHLWIDWASMAENLEKPL